MKRVIKPVYAMANISTQETGQSFILWIDSVGKNRKAKHGEIRVKAEYGNIEVEVGFKNGEYTTFQTSQEALNQFRKASDLKRYLIKMYSALLLHWNREISDTEFGAIAKYVKRGKTVDEAIQMIYDDRDTD